MRKWVDALSIAYKCKSVQSEMSLNYQLIVERYSFFNGVVGGLNPTAKSSLYLTGEKLVG